MEMSDGSRILKTGAAGLDDMLKGGLPENGITLLSGPPGIGKSNLGLQYIYKGIVDYNEPGIYLSVEYGKNEVKKYGSNFGWDLDSLEKDNKIAILEHPLIPQSKKGNKKSAVKGETIIEAASRIDAKRLTIDSITLFNYMYNDPDARRLHVLKFMSTLKKLNLTSLIISEQYGTWPQIEVDPDHFLADGLIQLFWIPDKNRSERCIRIAKIRGQEVDTSIRPFAITPTGVEVYPNQVPFALQ